MSEIVGLIPAAGSGKRMYPFSRAVPKELYPVIGKPVIEHCIENLRIGGVKNVYMIVGHQKGALMDYIGDGSFFGVNAAYIYQLKRRGIGHAILQAENWIKTTFAVLLGDSFIEPKSEIKELIFLHKKVGALATVLLFEVDDPTGYGIVRFKDPPKGFAEIDMLVEKPGKKEAEGLMSGGKYYAVCGAYVFEPKIFEYIKKTGAGAKGEIQITDSISLAAGAGEKVVGLVTKGKYLDIGKWNTVLSVEREMLTTNDISEFIKERNELAEKMQTNDDNG